MSIIKTGATIYLPEFNAYHKADVFKVNNSWIFVYNKHRLEPTDDVKEGAHCEVALGGGARTFHREGSDKEQHGVIAVPDNYIYFKQLKSWHPNDLNEDDQPETDPENIYDTDSVRQSIEEDRK